MNEIDANPVPETLPDSATEAARLARRRALRTMANPNRKVDYIAALSAMVNDGGPVVTISYVPGKLLIEPEAFASYLTALACIEPLESLALEVLGDINNEVVPRWVEVRVERKLSGGALHRVVVADREPRWDNPALLTRLC